ncbi:MAG: hypothetical protein GX130_05620 [Candidatus Hydrogenedens sp.]|jgi:Flp pilus assembly secretin CpaC|nr:hypothetical protein [Candidatus Hydrogenedens sp.]
MKKSSTYLLALLLLLCGFAQGQGPQQVNVSVKIIEFQTSKGSETGISAYFKQRIVPRPYGQVSTGPGIIEAASLAFPSRSTAGITLFLDQISTYYGDIEAILQALIDQNRAFILSQPKVMVSVGAAEPTIIKTTQDVPYENTVVVGVNAVQTTAFRPTGVTLTVSALQVVDDDGNPNTTHDQYIQLKLSAEINEVGQRITVALADSLSSTGAVVSRSTNAISVPEFVSRSLDTTVWVPNGQVLILGGLYRNTKNKNVSSLPWLTQGEDMVNQALEKVSPFSETPDIPLTSALGSKRASEARRELVFMVKADIWRQAFTLSEGFGLPGEEEEGEEGDEDIVHPTPPSGFIGTLFGGSSTPPSGVSDSLGGRE